jgi:Phosphotransferase enzyme family
MRSSRRPARIVPSTPRMRAAPDPRILTGWSGASPHVLRFPRRAFLRFPVCPPGSAPFPRLPLVSLRPAFSGSFPSAVAWVRFSVSFPPDSLSCAQPRCGSSVLMTVAGRTFPTCMNRSRTTSTPGGPTASWPGPRSYRAAFHDATAGSPLARTAEVACHGDISPVNTVFTEGQPVALIDFDMARPGTRICDAAYGLFLWLNLGWDGRCHTSNAAGCMSGATPTA